MTKTASWAIALATLAVFSQAHAAVEIWNKQFTTAPAWHRLTTDGNLIVGSDTGITAYGGSSGDELWVRNDLWASSASDIRFLGESGLFLAEPIPEAIMAKKKKKRPKRKKGDHPVFTAVDA